MSLPPAAVRACRKLDKATNAATKLDLTCALADALAPPNFSPSVLPARLTALCKALCPLLDAALQPQDWAAPAHLPHLDACSTLLSCLSMHLEGVRLGRPDYAFVLPTLQASGLLTVLPGALSKAQEVLTAPNSPGPRDLTFTQYLSLLMGIWCDMMRKTNTDCLYLQENDPVAPLLLPGAALAAAALQLYAGPEGEDIRSSNRNADGYEAILQLQFDVPKGANLPTAAQVRQAQQQLRGQRAGRTMCASVVANALRVADSFSVLAGFAKDRYLCETAPTPSDTLADQVLGKGDVMMLLAAVLFVLVKQLHSAQAGAAKATPPPTSLTGRAKKGGSQAAAKAADARRAANNAVQQVPPYHDKVAQALKLDLLAADEELFLDVTQYPPPALTPVLCAHDINTNLKTALLGLTTLLLHADAHSGKLWAAMIVGAAHNVRMNFLSDELSQAVLLTAVEVGLLDPSDHADFAMLVSVQTLQALTNSFVGVAGPIAALQCRAKGIWTQWPEGGSPFEHPQLQELLKPVLRDCITRLVPLLLPECLDIPTPASLNAPLPKGYRLKLMLPQAIVYLAAAASASTLSELLLDFPLFTTRALEAALRLDAIEQAVSPQCSRLLLRSIPAVLTRLGGQLPHSSDAPAGPDAPFSTLPTQAAAAAAGAEAAAAPAAASTATAATPAAAAPNKLLAALTGSGNRQLLLQVHALLATVVKRLGGINSQALSDAASAQLHEASAATAASGDAGARASLLPPEADSMLSPEMRHLLDHIKGEKHGHDSNAASNASGQFRATLGLLGSAAAAAAALGSAVTSQVAAAAPAATPHTGVGSSSSASDPPSSSGPDNNSSSRSAGGGSGARTILAPDRLAAPFVSLIGRCLYLVGAALDSSVSSSSSDGCSSSTASGLDDAAFDGCSGVLAALLSSLGWLSDAACSSCQGLLASTGAADAAAVTSLCGNLQAQLQQLTNSQPPQSPPAAATAAAAVATAAAAADDAAAAGAILHGRAVAEALHSSGLTAQLQSVGAAMCGVTTGVCGNPGCLQLSEVSEIALVLPRSGQDKQRGAGKCGGCGATSYCSRACQKIHWRTAHKAFCKARQQQQQQPTPNDEAAGAAGGYTHTS